MKRIILSAVAVAALTSSGFAQVAQKSAQPVTTVVAGQQKENKTKVEPADLPEAVKTTLAGDAYKGWTVNSAWLVKGETDYYSVELKKEDKTTTVNIDKDGKVK